jgi:dihydroorotate dehydrogenase
MSIYALVRPAIYLLDAERAHRLSLFGLKFAPAINFSTADPMLATTVAGLAFSNPIGLAAGYDKDAEVPNQLLRFGFGFVEVGTLTPKPQAGNPKPRLYRLVEDEAVINRMGFNNGGQAAALRRLTQVKAKGGVIGVNVGANKDSADRIADYVAGVRAMEACTSYLTINISSPNTPGLRALQDKGALADLLDGVASARSANGPPVFLKVAPDLEPQDVEDIATLAIAKKIDALIVSNTTISRPALQSRHAHEAGGLSGAPLRALAQQKLIAFRRATGGTLPLIGVGGISSAEDAYARIRAGASLIQLYSALVYHGPGLAKTINAGLKALLVRDGFTSISDAVGVDAS